MVLDVLRRGGRTEEEETGGRGLNTSDFDCSRSGRQLREVSGLQEMFSLAWERRCPLFSLSLARKPEGGSGSRRATSGGSDTPNCRRQRDTFPWLAQYLLCLFSPIHGLLANYSVILTQTEICIVSRLTVKFSA